MDSKSVGVILGLALLIYVSFSAGKLFELQEQEEKNKKYIKTIKLISESMDRTQAMLRGSKCLYFRSQKHSQ